LFGLQTKNRQNNGWIACVPPHRSDFALLWQASPESPIIFILTTELNGGTFFPCRRNCRTGHALAV